MSNEIPTIQASATLFAIVLGGTDTRFWLLRQEAIPVPSIRGFAH